MLGSLLVSCSSRFPLEQTLAAYREDGQYDALKIGYPLNETLFPPEIAPCTISWEDPGASQDTWVIRIQFEDKLGDLNFVRSGTNWTPRLHEWEQIKQRTSGSRARLTVLGVRRSAPLKILSRGQLSFGTSKDQVGASLFYREVNLPFKEAVKDPSRIRWRFGTIASTQPPPVVLEHLPVCGNCHSFSLDGRTLGMDVDYANNKGSYVITRVAPQMVLASSEIIAWDDYRPEDHRKTYGLLSQVSPDGQVVASTVKDKSVFAARSDLAFSQLFFPIQGILALYHRNNGTFQSLPGADNPEYVQSNPVWSPDGKYIVFARAKAYQLKSKEANDKLLLDEEDCAEFLREGKSFQFDLYRIPYNDGRGGQAEPLIGASKNGRSNFFAKYSPDGKWIIFCQAKSYMLLQPDSELFIVPAAGGEARRLRCNTARMNSWHSWSPNSRWLVFSSKANSPYTQLFLTHIDEQGESTPPILLDHLTEPDRAANIPEFVNASPGAIGRIREQFLDDYSHARAAYVLESAGDFDKAIEKYRQALEINPRNAHAHQRLGFLLYNVKREFAAGLAETKEAVNLDPNDGCAHCDLGVVLSAQGKFDLAIEQLTLAIRLMPEGFDRRYNPADMHCWLGEALLSGQKPQEAAKVLQEAVTSDPKHARAHYLLAFSLAIQGMTQEPAQHYNTAYSLQANVDTIPEFHFLMSVNYQKTGELRQALVYAQRGLQLVREKRNSDQVRAFETRVEECRKALEGL